MSEELTPDRDRTSACRNCYRPKHEFVCSHCGFNEFQPRIARTEFPWGKPRELKVDWVPPIIAFV